MNNLTLVKLKPPCLENQFNDLNYLKNQAAANTDRLVFLIKRTYPIPLMYKEVKQIYGKT